MPEETRQARGRFIGGLGRRMNRSPRAIVLSE
jgi:hypothetical protein